jgi:hypothetical protein
MLVGMLIELLLEAFWIICPAVEISRLALGLWNRCPTELALFRPAEGGDGKIPAGGSGTLMTSWNVIAVDENLGLL